MNVLLELVAGTGCRTRNPPPTLSGGSRGDTEAQGFTLTKPHMTELIAGFLQGGEKISETQKAKPQSVGFIINTTSKEGEMKRRRFLAVSVGMLVLGWLLLAGGPGVTPVEAQKSTPQQQQQQILEKLDQILAATKSGEKDNGAGAKDNQTLRWDQVLPAEQRFVILPAFNSDAVLDKETGLVWEKSPQPKAVGSSSARSTCVNKAVGGRKGWRLPSLSELASLVDPSVGPPGPTLPPGHPFVAAQPVNYWSGSAYAENPAQMWGVGFLNGVALGLSKSFEQRIWCVRGGMSADQ